MRSNNRLILFVKSPKICRVKTRMQTHLSHRECLFLHRKLTEGIIKQCSKSSQFQLIIYTTEATHMQFYSGRGNAMKRQVGSYLGERMFNAIQQELKCAQRVVLIGSDSFSLNLNYIENAFDQLKSAHDIVIGPTHDGGYVLVGMKKPNRKVFERVSWGTSSVTQQTLKQASDCRVYLLKKVFDIDRFEDLDKNYKQKGLPDWALNLLN